jgi:hypothetical protein
MGAPVIKAYLVHIYHSTHKNPQIGHVSSCNPNPISIPTLLECVSTFKGMPAKSHGITPHWPQLSWTSYVYQ